MNLTRSKLAVASKASKEDVLAKVDEKKVKINLNELGKSGIARQANVADADLKHRVKITEEEKRKS